MQVVQRHGVRQHLRAPLQVLRLVADRQPFQCDFVCFVKLGQVSEHLRAVREAVRGGIQIVERAPELSGLGQLLCCSVEITHESADAASHHYCFDQPPTSSLWRQRLGLQGTPWLRRAAPSQRPACTTSYSGPISASPGRRVLRRTTASSGMRQALRRASSQTPTFCPALVGLAQRPVLV